MKTFAYLALIGTALAVRLTSGDDAATTTDQDVLDAFTAVDVAVDALSEADKQAAVECAAQAIDDELEA